MPWYEGEGLLAWYEQTKCEHFLEDTDTHFKKLQITNFDIINSNGQISDEKLKQYQTTDHQEIMKYLLQLRNQIIPSIFHSSKRDVMFVQSKHVVEHFKKPIKNIGRGRFMKKIKDDFYKETS